MKGTVKWFSLDRGYGFITSESGEDHYFNDQSVNGVALPSNGDSVSFESKIGNKGRRASNVVITAKVAPKRSRTISRSRYIDRNSNKTDDRIECPGCGKKIVPRLIISDGEPHHSVCPYCAETVKHFKWCFIATAVYGDNSCYEVRSLRSFRDEKLQMSILGRHFIKLYYLVSPPIAVWLLGKPKLSSYIRAFLDIMIKHITKK